MDINGNLKIKKKAFIFDVDGTISNGNGRDFYNPKPEEILADLPIYPTLEVLKYLWHPYQIIFLSGREAKFYEPTKTWIKQHTPVKDPQLYMRKTGDQRKDCIIKWEIVEKDILPNYDIIAVFDDRKQVIDMWLEKGIFVFDVGQGCGNF